MGMLRIATPTTSRTVVPGHTAAGRRAGKGGHCSTQEHQTSTRVSADKSQDRLSPLDYSSGAE